MAELAMLYKRTKGPEHKVFSLVPKVCVLLEFIRKANQDCHILLWEGMRQDTCMCVRSISVGCVSNVAAIAATVPDEKLIAVCGAPCCTSTGMFRKLHLASGYV